MALCQVCNHDHEEDGTCECGCKAEQQMETICWSCGHVVHNERECKCGCTG